MATATPPAGTIGHDQAAQILRMSPAELTRLASAGIVPRVGPGIYHPGTIIGTYIEHLRAEVAQLREQLKRARPETQDEIAHYLDISDRRLRELLAEWGISHKTTPLDQIRVRYIRKLREEAAGRADVGGEDGLVSARTREANERADRLALQNAQLRGEVAPIDLLGDALAKTIEIMVSELEQIDAALVKVAPDMPEPVRQAVLTCVNAARNKIKDRLGSLKVDDIDPSGDIDDEEGNAP